MTTLERPLGSGVSIARREELAPSAGTRAGALPYRSRPVHNVAAPPEQHAAHSAVPTTTRNVTVEPPRGGDSSASTRSAHSRVAPALVRALARAAVLAAAFFIVHAAPTNIWSALAVAAAALALTAVLATRR
jgi:hypothetical protein